MQSKKFPASQIFSWKKKKKKIDPIILFSFYKPFGLVFMALVLVKNHTVLK